MKVTVEKLLRSIEWWKGDIEDKLFASVDDYMKTNNLNQTQLAKQINVSKSYISQVLNGYFDFKISKLVEIALAVGKAPVIEYKDLSQEIENYKIKIRRNIQCSSSENDHQAIIGNGNKSKSTVNTNGRLQLDMSGRKSFTYSEDSDYETA